MTAGRGPLLERDVELAFLREGLAAAEDGRGSCACLEAPAGLGKTRVVATIVAEARDRGFRVLTARGGELEREFAFGVVRQLFEDEVLNRPSAERRKLLGGGAEPAAAVLRAAGESGADDYAPIDGLYWLSANLAAHGPLLLAIDDAHWADLRSLRFLVYLARRLEGLPLFLVLAFRTPEFAEAADFLTELGEPGTGQWLRLAPLGRTSIERLLPAGASPAFISACEELTGGNPFLLEVLAAAREAEGIAPDDAGTLAVRELVPETLTRWLLVQLGRSEPAARELARAVALLGEPAELRIAARLASLPLSEAAKAADDLARAGILKPGTPLAYVHALVRHAVHEEMAPAVRAQRHGDAARLLAADGAPVERVAAQLLVAERNGDGWTVETLRAAAREAVHRGAPESAAALLRRALEEPPPPDSRIELLIELGDADEPAAAVAPLREALSLTPDPVRRVRVRERLAVRLISVAAFEEAVALLQEALREAPSELAPRIEGLLVAVRVSARPGPEADQARGRLLDAAAQTASDPLLRAARARTLVAAGRRTDELYPLVDEIRGIASWSGREMLLVSYVGNALTWADDLDEADVVWEHAREVATRLGALEAHGFVMTFHPFAKHRRGALLDAEADTRAALELGSEHRWPGTLFTVAMFVELARERGFASEAWAALSEWQVPEEPPDAWPFVYLLESRGRLRVAEGAVAAGLRDILEAGRRLEGRGMTGPGVSSWRSAAALAHLRLGNDREAAELAHDELEHARRFGSPRALGIALRALGLVSGGKEGIALLEESCSALSRSPARLEHARSLAELGAALRRDGQRRMAQERLREALDLAHRAGATVLADHVVTEIRAAGGRPRRPVLSGTASLTPSELRVARLAAGGSSNRDIAQALFVTVRTVENHLTHVYRKLDISSRADIPAALDTAG